MRFQRFLKSGRVATLSFVVAVGACSNSPSRPDAAKEIKDASGGGAGGNSGGSGGGGGASGGGGGGGGGKIGGNTGTGGSTGPYTIAVFQGDLNGFQANTGWDGGAVGANLAWTGYAGTQAFINVDTTVGNPPGSMKFEIPFTNYMQFINADVGFREQDWTDKTIRFDIKTAGPLPPSLKANGGISFQLKDMRGGAYYGFWKTFKSEPNLDDGNWHTISLKLPATIDKFDQTVVNGITIQVGSGGIPASAAVDGGVDGGASSVDSGVGNADGGVGNIDGGAEGADGGAPVVLPGMGTVILYFDNIIVG